MALPLCACYCGKQVNTRKREFLPGHDAKLKSAMQRAYRTDTEVEIPTAYSQADPSLPSSVSALAIADQRGWHHFLTDGKQTPSDGERDNHEPGVDDPHVDAQVDVTGFRPVQVKVGRWVYDAQVVNYPEGSDGPTITVEYRDGKGELHTKTVTRDKIVG